MNEGLCIDGGQEQDGCCLGLESRNMTRLPIVWQRLVSGGKTCERCGATEVHLQTAVSKLRQVLAPLNIEPTFEVRDIDQSSFKETPSESNRIWIAGVPLEQLLGASVGSSTCCSVCGDAPCRTVEVEGVVHEEIPEAVIVRAALIAASGLIGRSP
jgi:hypothetical protein